MGWASFHIEKLKNNETVQFRPKGNSMSGRIDDGQLVTVSPVDRTIEKNDIVLCSVNGNQYLHIVKAIGPDGRYQIGNNHGHINGWASAVYGIVKAVE